MLDARLHSVDSAVTAPGAAAYDPRPSRLDAEAAVRTLIRWAGDRPGREGLLDTPARVVRAYEEWFGGYALDPEAILGRSFDRAGYDDLVLLRDIPVRSVCEHHMAAIRGVAHVAYLPGERVVGISKLARLVDAYARRLQIQERLTAEVAQCIWDNLSPRGVAVVIDAEHACMTARGVRTPGVSMVTSRVMGIFRSDQRSREEVLKLMGY